MKTCDCFTISNYKHCCLFRYNEGACKMKAVLWLTWTWKRKDERLRKLICMETVKLLGKFGGYRN